MAVEEAILLATDKDLRWNTLRFWRNYNSVVLGRFQSVIFEVNLEACAKYGTAIVRRFTGGGTVYHDYGNLNWTVVIQKNRQLESQGISSIFEICSKPLVRALRDLGVDANFKAPNTIEVNNKKVSGMAAYSTKKTVLCHGTLLVSTNLKILNELLNPINQEEIEGRTGNRVRSNRAEVTNLYQELTSDRVEMKVVKELILDHFQRIFDVTLENRKLEIGEERLADSLFKGKYSLFTWNFEHTYNCQYGKLNYH
jgi:lipoate-protein ligase A